MARISGVNIPSDKALYISLQYIYGIGNYTAHKICKDLSLDPREKVSGLSSEVISSIRAYIDSNVEVEGDLRRKIANYIKRLQNIVCYRGLRHRYRLPSRGQRTHTNSRTRRRVS